jgi:hypothetical protein
MKFWKAWIIMAMISTGIIIPSVYGIQKYLEYKFSVIPTVSLNLLNMILLTILVFGVSLVGIPIVVEHDSWKRVN